MSNQSDPIYVVVDVSYDYFRFQDNVGATTDLEAARKIATEYAERFKYDKLPVIDDAEESKRMDKLESRHVWIERWPKNQAPAVEEDEGGES